MEASYGEVYVGIDVSKRTLDMAVLPDGHYRVFSNDPAGLEHLVKHLGPVRPRLIVLEATGGLQLRAAAALSAAGLAVAVVNPRNVRDFARASGQLAKTDKLDAAIIARFAAAMQPEPRPLPDAQRQALIDLVARRRQLIEMRVAEKLRRATMATALRPRLDDHLTWLAQAISELDREIEDAVRASDIWRNDEALLTSVPGVGPQTAATLIAGLPELGKIAAAKLSALVGLAPLNNDSGIMRGHRTIKGGRADIRCALYMATVAATRHNPTIKAFHQRLRSAGKPPKVALTACMHKLLLILHAIVRTQTPWRAA